MPTTTIQSEIITVKALAEELDKPHSTGFTIIGDLGGRSAVTGSMERSSLIPGTYTIELEHGVVHLEDGYILTVERT